MLKNAIHHVRPLPCGVQGLRQFAHLLLQAQLQCKRRLGLKGEIVLQAQVEHPVEELLLAQSARNAFGQIDERAIVRAVGTDQGPGGHPDQGMDLAKMQGALAVVLRGQRRAGELAQIVRLAALEQGEFFRGEQAENMGVLRVERDLLVESLGHRRGAAGQKALGPGEQQRTAGPIGVDLGDADGVFALGAGEQRGFGQPEKRFRLGGVFRVQGAAYGRRDLAFEVGLQKKRRRHRADHRFHAGLHVFQRNVVIDQGKGIRADARENLDLRQLAQALGHLQQHAVARDASPAGVDFGKPVEIEHDDSQLPRWRQVLAQGHSLGLKTLAIEQSGERITFRGRQHVATLLLVLSSVAPNQQEQSRDADEQQRLDAPALEAGVHPACRDIARGQRGNHPQWVAAHLFLRHFLALPCAFWAVQEHVSRLPVAETPVIARIDRAQGPRRREVVGRAQQGGGPVLGAEQKDRPVRGIGLPVSQTHGIGGALAGDAQRRIRLAPERGEIRGGQGRGFGYRSGRIDDRTAGG